MEYILKSHSHFFILLNGFLSKGQYLDWLVTANGKEYIQGSAMKVDFEQNIVIAGNFSGTVDFDPVAPTLIL